ncbi:potassium voltage-gated channel subfamily A member 1-like [Bolinopsis microptera]|uniref:potassium voltage-gated channel subfamily A member 1-like n=1 Tax=Bolinopsis microptera TaxID=2820187 RepID=UPI003079C9A6
MHLNSMLHSSPAGSKSRGAATPVESERRADYINKLKKGRYSPLQSPNADAKVNGLSPLQRKSILKNFERSMTIADINYARMSPASRNVSRMSPPSMHVSRMSPVSMNVSKMSPASAIISNNMSPELLDKPEKLLRNKIEQDLLTIDGKAPDSNLIYINCSGLQYVTTEETLSRFPDSLLANPEERQALYSQQLDAFYLDRHMSCFESILQFYQTGVECPPPFIDLEIYEAEKVFYGLYKPQDTVIEIEESITKDGSNLCCAATKMAIHKFLVNPPKRGLASIYHVTDIVMIVVGTILFLLESEDSLEDKFDLSKVSDSKINLCLLSLNAMTILWFTVDSFLRMVTWPKFTDYWKSIMNLLDVISVLPFYIEMVQWAFTSNADDGNYAILRALKLVRVVRVFKFLRHSQGLVGIMRAMGKARQELVILFIAMFLFVITFGSIMYYLENVESHHDPDGSGPSSQFSSIPMSCWWVLVSITTVGFGDMYPVTLVGKLVGSVVLCLGVVMLALPMTIIVSKFNTELEQENNS